MQRAAQRPTLSNSIRMIIPALLLAAAVGSAPAPAGTTVSVDVTEANKWIGSRIEVQAWDRPEVTIEQEVINANASDVHPAISHTGSSVTIVAEYTGTRSEQFFGLIRHGSNGYFRWVIHVPSKSALRVRESN